MISRLLSAPSARSFFLFGPRLTGKSTWLRRHLGDALTIDLLSERNFLTYLADPSRLHGEVAAFLAKNPSAWIVIDEVQRAPSLLNEVHRAIEGLGAKFALSGSSARKLKRGGANLLAGRAVEKKLFPLTSIELGDDFDTGRAVQWGSLPALVGLETVEKREILSSYVSTYLREEIQAEGIVRNLPSFSKFLQLCAESAGQEVDYTSISRETTVTSKTIREYYSILEDTLIGFFLPPWSTTVRKELAGKPKFYLFDNGVTNALRENLTDRPTGSVFGVLFEQLCVQQTRALLSYRGFEGSMHYWKARGGNEVDLILARGKKPILALEFKATRSPSARDFSGLRSFQDEYPRVPRLLVTQQPRASKLNGEHSLPAEEYFHLLWHRELVEI